MIYIQTDLFYYNEPKERASALVLAWKKISYLALMFFNDDGFFSFSMFFFREISSRFTKCAIIELDYFL